MRISTDEHDPGYTIYAPVGVKKLTVQGCNDSDLFKTVDQERREALRVIRDKNRKWLFDEHGQLCVELLTNVDIVIEFEEGYREKIIADQNIRSHTFCDGVCKVCGKAEIQLEQERCIEK